MRKRDLLCGCEILREAALLLLKHIHRGTQAHNPVLRVTNFNS
jgi:hypothetical protein